MSEQKELNWVERRARDEKILDEQAREVWSQVRSAVEDVCRSFAEHYEREGRREVLCEMENVNRLRIGRTLLADKVKEFAYTVMTAVVEFDARTRCVGVVWDTGSAKFAMLSDREGAYVYLIEKDERLSADEVSKRILEPLLFPEPAR